MKKAAECVRQAANWSRIQPHHRFDSAQFDAKRTAQDMAVASPKLVALLAKIRELDERDMAEHGHRFKHMIFSDVKTLGYGAKIAASAFVAAGYKPAFGEDFRLQTPSGSGANRFAVLSSTPLYKRAVTVRLRNEILAAFNDRPSNVHGDRLRFIILDQGYKEGIDLFDIRYIHIIEPPLTLGDERQVIGRGTRFCGQKGLTFHPEQGWPLYVFRYDVGIPTSIQQEYRGAITLSDLYNNLMGIDARKNVFAAEIERYAILGAADHPLTQALHRFHIPGIQGAVPAPAPSLLSPRVKELVAEPRSPEAIGTGTPTIPDTIEMYGKRYSRSEAVRCADGCRKLIPVPTPFFMLVWVATSNDPEPFYLRHPRHWFCRAFERNVRYCNALNGAWRDPYRFFERYEARIHIAIERLAANKKVYQKHIQTMYSYAASYRHVEIPKKRAPPSHAPPAIPLSYWRMQRYVQREYGDLEWKNIQIENLCADKPEGESQPAQGRSKIIAFTPTQDFVRQFLTPTSPYKGLLAYHSVGTGKLCTAIATATTAFEQAGYTILYVTRHTLKADVWKNVFDSVCSLVLQERMRRGETIPETQRARLAMLSRQWIHPISYRQLTNMLRGKNSLHKEMVRRNGRDDPLRRTLLIIDEAHKLFAPDMGNEKPDMAALVQSIQHSYEASGANSVRVLMMTATPMANDPLDLVRILNLMRPASDAILADSYGAFAEAYLDDAGRFTPRGAARFLNEIAGYISYLNREKDIRQFAYPILDDVVAPLSQPPIEIAALEAELEGMDAAAEELQEEYEARLGECQAETHRADKKVCKDAAKEWFSTEKRALKERAKEIRAQIKNTKGEDISQDTVIRTTCLHHLV